MFPRMIRSLGSLCGLCLAFILMAAGCGKVQEMAQTAGDAAKNAVDQASGTAKPADAPATTPSQPAPPSSAAKTPSVDPEQFLKEFEAINRSEISDNELAQLASLGTAAESVVFVDLTSNLVVTPAGMGHLAKLPNLEKLDLSSSGVTAEGLAQLKSAPHLTWLRLGSNPNIDDRAAAVLSELPHLKFLGLEKSPLSNDGLKSIAKIKSLEELDLGGITGISGPGIAALVEMPNISRLRLNGANGLPDLQQGLLELVKCKRLRELDLGYCGLADAHMVVFRNWQQLERVDLSLNVNLSDKGLVILKQLNNLTSLNATKTGLTDEGLNQLSNRRLEVLEIGETAVSNQGMRAIKNCPGLRVLDVSSTAVGDLGMAQIKGLKNLEQLSIAGTQVSDQGLSQLVGLKSLKVLNTRGSQVTDAGRTAIANAIPGLSVDPQ